MALVTNAASAGSCYQLEHCRSRVDSTSAALPSSGRKHRELNATDWQIVAHHHTPPKQLGLLGKQRDKTTPSDLLLSVLSPYPVSGWGIGKVSRSEERPTNRPRNHPPSSPTDCSRFLERRLPSCRHLDRERLRLPGKRGPPASGTRDPTVRPTATTSTPTMLRSLSVYAPSFPARRIDGR